MTNNLKKSFSSIPRMCRNWILEPFVSQDFSHIDRRKSRVQLIRLSAAVMGIEFCYAAETAFVSPTLLRIGVSHLSMTLIWCLSPLLGFFLTPMLGSMSDRCTLTIGRRRPFILLLSIGIILGLILVPNGQHFGLAMGDTQSSGHLSPTGNITDDWLNENFNSSNKNMTVFLYTPPTTVGPWGLFFTILGTVLLDFDSDACQSPSRAYLLDVTLPEDHVRGLSTFTVMAGVGGAVGYALGAVDWNSTIVGSLTGSDMRALFSLILILFVVCLLTTLCSFREMPLQVHLQKKMMDLKKEGVSRVGSYHLFQNEEEEEEDEYRNIGASKTYGSLSTSISAPSVMEINKNDVIEETSFTCNIVKFGLSSLIINAWVICVLRILWMANNRSQQSKYLLKRTSSTVEASARKLSITTPSSPSIREYFLSIVRIPGCLRVVCITNLFCWMSLVCYSLYFTDFVGEEIFRGDPRAPIGSAAHTAYQEGVRFGCWAMSVYSLSCSIYSLNIDKLINKFSAKPVYIGGQLVYSIGMVILAILRHPVAAVLLSCTAGIMYSTLFTMPYLLVAHYHTTDLLQECCVRGLGTDVAVVSSMVFVAQFLLSAIMGSLVVIARSTVVVVCSAAFLSFCGAISASQIFYSDL